MATAHYIGEFECTIDDKSRMMVPAGLIRQFPKKLRGAFVINRSVFQKCLVLHPMDAWEETVNDLRKLNRFNKKNDDFIRQYVNGGAKVELDKTNRMLIPKHLTEYAKIKSDIVLTASVDKIEIWSAKNYKDMMSSYDPAAFGALAEEVMGKLGNKGEADTK